MSEKYAGLTLGVDVSQVNNAVKSLRDFKQANDSAKKSVEGFVDQNIVAKQKAKDHAQELARQRKEYQAIQAAIDPTASKMERLKTVAGQLDRLWAKGIVPDEKFFEFGEMLETQQNKLIASRKALTEEGRAALESAKAKAKAAQEGKRFIDALERQAAMAGKTQSELTELRAAQLGVTKEAAPFIAKMKEQEAQFKKMGISAGQYAQAMRLLPVQLTDVAVSLASGMPAWMVILQQGSQIKDSFGGIAPMFEAIKKAVSGAGNELSDQIDKAAESAANLSEGINNIAEAGRLIRNMHMVMAPMLFAITAAGAALGVMIYNTIKAAEEFKRLRTMVNESMGLTGDYANRVAQTIHDVAEATGKSTDEVAKAFVTTKDGAHDVIKKLIDVGMSYNEASKYVAKYKGESNFTALNGVIADHKMQVVKLKESWMDVAKSKAKAFAIASLALTTGAYSNIQARKEEIKAVKLVDRVKVLTEDLNKAQKQVAIDQAEAAKHAEEQYYATNALATKQKELNELLKSQKLLASTTNEEAKKFAAEAVKAKQKEIAELQKQQAKKDAPDKPKAGPKSSVEQLDKELYVLQAQLRTLKEHRTVNDVISNQRKSLWSIEKQIEILQEASRRRTLTAAEKKLLAEQQSVLELAKQKAEIGDQIMIQERSNKLYQSSLEFIRQANAEIAALDMKQRGMTDQQIQREMQLQQIRDQYIEGGGGIGDQALADMLAKQREVYAQQDALQANWLAGVKDAWNQFEMEATDVYGNIQNIASSALNGLSDQLADFLTTGKANFRDFASNIIKMIVQMITKMAVFNAISAMTGGKTVSFAGMFGGRSGGGESPAVAAMAAPFAETAMSRMGDEGGMYRAMRAQANSFAGARNSGGGIKVSGAGSQFNIGDINVDVNNGDDPKGLETGVRMLFTELIQRACSQGGEVYNFVKGNR